TPDPSPPGPPRRADAPGRSAATRPTPPGSGTWRATIEGNSLSSNIPRVEMRNTMPSQRDGLHHDACRVQVTIRHQTRVIVHPQIPGGREITGRAFLGLIRRQISGRLPIAGSISPEGTRTIPREPTGCRTERSTTIESCRLPRPVRPAWKEIGLPTERGHG